MSVNAKTCIRILIEHSKPIEDMLEYLARNNCESIPTNVFQVYVKKLLENIDLQMANSPHRSRVKFEITESYDIKTLQRHDYIIVDEGKNLISLNDFVDSLFRHIVDKMLLKPIPERKFRQHENNLSVIINESKRFNTKNKLEREAEIEYIKEFLRSVKSDFSSNLIAIDTHSDNLSKLIESNNKEYSKRDIMREIVTLCDKYIEPFFRFLQTTTRNQNAFIYKLSKLQDFFDAQGFVHEANDINRFIIHFSKYIDEIKVIYDRINDYRRKGQQDLLVFNAFEHAFNNLKNCAQSVLDGKTIKNTLDSSEFHHQYSKLASMPDSRKRMIGGIDLKYIVNNAREIETFLMMESNKEATVSEVILDDIKLAEIAAKQEAQNRTSQKHRKNKMLITAIIKKYLTYLCAPSDDEDLIQKIYKVLKKHFPQDEFSGHLVIVAYYHIRNNQVKNIETGFNRRRYFIDQKSNIKYIYRPVFARQGAN